MNLENLIIYRNKIYDKLKKIENHMLEKQMLKSTYDLKEILLKDKNIINVEVTNIGTLKITKDKENKYE